MQQRHGAEAKHRNLPIVGRRDLRPSWGETCKNDDREFSAKLHAIVGAKRCLGQGLY
jgi:hypothetical protein